LAQDAVNFYYNIKKMPLLGARAIGNAKSEIKSSEPSWLIEITKKGRFRSKKPIINKGIYVCINQGKTSKISLS